MKHREISFPVTNTAGRLPHYFILCGEDYITNPVAQNKQEVTCHKCLELEKHINEIQQHIICKPELAAGYTNFNAILRLKGFKNMMEAIKAGYTFVHDGKCDPTLNIIKN